MLGILRISVFLFVFGTIGQASALALFFDDFETDLSQWGTNANGQIVVDPLDNTNRVLNFSAVNSAGDIFSSIPIALTSGQTYRVEFDYLGISGTDSSSGGFAGLANGTPGTHVWFAGTTASALTTLTPAAIVLPDDAGWNSIAYTFIAPLGGLATNSIRLMFEDFLGSGSIAGNAYFDNVQLSVVPLPAALPLFGTGLAVMGFIGWRRKRQATA